MIQPKSNSTTWQRLLIKNATKEGLIGISAEQRALGYEEETEELLNSLNKKRTEARQQEEKFELDLLQDYKYAADTFGLKRILIARQAAQDILTRVDSIIDILEAMRKQSQ